MFVWFVGEGGETKCSPQLIALLEENDVVSSHRRGARCFEAGGAAANDHNFLRVLCLDSQQVGVAVFGPFGHHPHVDFGKVRGDILDHGFGPHHRLGLVLGDDV